MSTMLEQSIQEALQSQGDNQHANKAYLEFIKANFIIPIEKSSESDSPKVLYLQEENHVFLAVFTEMTYLDNWATDIRNDIELLKLSGVDLLKGVGDNIHVCLNIGSTSYKEFNPSEIARMRSIVLKLFTKS